MAKQRIRVAVLGGSGYTGGELLRLLAGHPAVTITTVTAEKSVGLPVSTLFPNLAETIPLTFTALDPGHLVKQADIVFCALPHTQSMGPVDHCLQAGVLAIDLSADYRLKNPDTYHTWYHTPHSKPHLLKKAVYGLPELHRSAIRTTRLVAVPGCYPTAAILQLAPLYARNLLQPGSVIIDAKSGISGAGRSPALPFHFPESHESVKAYKIGEHRHTPEIEQALNSLARQRRSTQAKNHPSDTITFTPHLIPINRGILSTAYGRLRTPLSLTRLRTLYKKFYEGESFIRQHEDVMAISPSYVRGSNFCDLGIFFNHRTGQVITVAALDNLVKGAAGQAIQCMNILLGFPETTGLDKLPAYP
ncbi:MAG: N-acetyl-gamma-glutamyl-phosphate reductase [Nitrospirales bacterium]|nr:N-acetyl-gamma-glutamyl-phosphate reductase [Nitrospirales bacterium]